jgi:hypothetical protein
LLIWVGQGKKFSRAIAQLQMFMNVHQLIPSLPGDLPFPTASFSFKMHLLRRHDNPFLHKAGNLP